MAAERDIETYLRNKIKQRGGLALKLVCPNFVGVPDRLCFLPGGKIFFVEVKRETGKLSPVQIRAHSIISGFGQKVYTVYSKLDVDVLLTEVL